MKTKYAFFEKYSDKLVDSLEKSGVKYKIVGDGEVVERFIKFSLDGAHQETERLRRIIKTAPIETVEYSQKELETAKYLVIRPKKNTITISNEDNAFKFLCGRKSVFGFTRYNHKEQIGILKIDNTPKSICKTAFFGSSEGGSEVFVDYRIRNAIEEKQLTGFMFLPVDSKQGINSTLFQIDSEQIVTFDMLDLSPDAVVKKMQHLWAKTSHAQRRLPFEDKRH